MVMRIRQYSAERIAQYGRSRATLDMPLDAVVIDLGVKKRFVEL
jgi:hypothetical protein